MVANLLNTLCPILLWNYIPLDNLSSILTCRYHLSSLSTKILAINYFFRWYLCWILLCSVLSRNETILLDISWILCILVAYWTWYFIVVLVWVMLILLLPLFLITDRIFLFGIIIGFIYILIIMQDSTIIIKNHLFIFSNILFLLFFTLYLLLLLVNGSRMLLWMPLLLVLRLNHIWSILRNINSLFQLLLIFCILLGFHLTMTSLLSIVVFIFYFF